MHTLKVLFLFGFVVFVRTFAALMAIAAVGGAIFGVLYLIGRKVQKAQAATEAVK